MLTQLAVANTVFFILLFLSFQTLPSVLAANGTSRKPSKPKLGATRSYLPDCKTLVSSF